MAKATMVGGPEDGRDDIDIEPFQKTIEIHEGSTRWSVPIRNRRIYWNERQRL